MNADRLVNRRVAVIGAGWSGLACAWHLGGNGRTVALFDAAAQAGGRARGVRLTLGERDYLLDNGQHLLIGAYRETLRLMREVGVDVDAALLRRPFELNYPDGFSLRARRLPAPWHLAAALLAARGLDWSTRTRAMAWVQHWRRRAWTLGADAPASELFVGAPQVLLRRLWRPLCLAALNVELEQASAQVLLNVLRDSLAAEAQASDLLIPRCDLSKAFAEPALDALRSRGVETRLPFPIQAISRTGERWQLSGRDSTETFDAVVLALPPQRAAVLLASIEDARLEPTIVLLRAIATAPIATVYLRYAATTRLARPAVALLDNTSIDRHGQWVFDRGQLDPANAGVLSVVVSAAAGAADDSKALVAAAAAQLSTDLGLPAPLAGVAIVEKRATIVPSPGLRRPPAKLPLPGLYLAGDAAHSGYPSTLEGSVRAGFVAAQALIDDEQRTC